MGRHTLEIPLPGRLECRSCADQLHVDLMQEEGVHQATLDIGRSLALVEVDDDAPPLGQIVARLAHAFAGPAAHGSLERHHTGHPAFRRGGEPGGGTTQPVPTDLGPGHPAPRPSATGPEGRPVPGTADPAAEAAQMRAAARSNQRRLLLVLLVGTLVMTAEIIGGLLANSLVLLADAAHYATDILSVLIAFVAVSVGMRRATARKTFGFQRGEVVAAFVQALALWAVSIYLLWEAYQRIREPPTVEGPIVLFVGGGTLVINALLALILHRGGGHNVNMRAAFIHILSDVFGSAAALVAGALIYFRGLHIADPILTLFITLLILVFTWRLTKQTLHILLEGVPHHVDPAVVERALRDLPTVKAVHDLHVWTLTSGVDSLSAHVVLDTVPRDDTVAHAVHNLIRERFRINHITVQIEDPNCPCDTLQHDWTTPTPLREAHSH